MTSTAWRDAVVGDDAVRLDRGDAGADQVDVVAREGAQPAAVVLQRALAGRRVVRHHLGQQFGIVADLAGDPLGEHHPGDLVDLADRPLLVGIVRVDARGVQALVAARPEQQEAVPAAVERQVPQRPLHAGSDRLVVVRVREHPLRGALEHGEVLDVGRRSSGAIWKPLAPAPIIATRLPRRSTVIPLAPSGTPARRTCPGPGCRGGAAG